MLCAVPLVEVTDDANAFCIRGPDGKCDAAFTLMSSKARAELFVNALVFAFAEEVQIEFAEGGRELRG